MAGLAWILLTPLRTFLPRAALVVLFAAVAVVSLLIDLRLLRRPLRGSQVPQTWVRRYGFVRGFALYGLFLGSGLLTHVPHAATYTLFAGLCLFLPPWSAVVAGALFGLGRTAIVGPAALAADPASKLLYRSRASNIILPPVSALLSVGLLLGVGVGR
jgi:hypothetical protein